LTGLSQPTLAALRDNHPKIRTYTTKEQIEKLINFLVAILNIKASTPDEIKKLDVQMVLVWDLIKTKFGSLTFEQVQEAMKMYVSKEFPDIKVFRLLDCISIGEILNAFNDYTRESLTVYDDKKKRLLELKPSEQTPEEIEKLMIDSVESFYQHYKENGLLKHSPAHYVFDFLVEQGKIKLAGENQIAIKAYYKEKTDEAQSQLLKEQKVKKANSKSQRMDIQDELRRIHDGSSKAIVTRAKELVLLDFFDAYKKNNTQKIF